MAKPAKAKKKSTAAAPAKKGKKADAKARPKGKTKAKKQDAGGIKGRMAKAQSMKTAKAKSAPKKKEGSRTVQFLREVKVELTKVTWPTREELIQSTVAVIVAVAIAGVFIFAFDALFNWLIGLIS